MAKFKELQVGQQVRLVSTKHTDSQYGYAEDRMLEVGAVGTITDLRTTDKAVRLDGNPYVYHRKDLEIVAEPVAEQPVLTTESSTSKVDASTPVGTKVRVLQGSEGGVYGAGAVGTLGRHDADDYPRIDFLDDYWYPHYDNLEIVPQDTPDTVCKPELEPAPVAPKELTLEDFVVTRVRVLSTGVKGTVIGHLNGGSIAVQHDVGSKKVWLHECSVELGNAQGAKDRCYWYSVAELEIINEGV